MFLHTVPLPFPGQVHLSDPAREDHHLSDAPAAVPKSRQSDSDTERGEQFLEVCAAVLESVLPRRLGEAQASQPGHCPCVLPPPFLSFFFFPQSRCPCLQGCFQRQVEMPPFHAEPYTQSTIYKTATSVLNYNYFSEIVKDNDAFLFRTFCFPLACFKSKSAVWEVEL